MKFKIGDHVRVKPNCPRAGEKAEVVQECMEGVPEHQQRALSDAIEDFIFAGGSAVDVLDRLDDFGEEETEGVWHFTPIGFRQAMQSFTVGAQRVGRERRERTEIRARVGLPQTEAYVPSWAKPLP